MKVLVTGATGFIGSHIAQKLAGHGDTVRALVRPSSDTSHLEGIGIELVRGDLREPGSLREPLRGAEVVYHCAAVVGDWGRWADFHEVGVRGTERLVKEALRAGVRRLVHLSSVAVYGLRRVRGRTVTEEMPPAPRLWRWDYYGRAKQAAERSVVEAGSTGRIEAFALRPTLVYGPRDRAIVPRMAHLLRARRLPVFGSGRNRLHLIYVEDVAEAAVLAGTTAAGPLGIYHFDGRKEITQRGFFNAIADLIGAPRPRLRIPFGLSYGLAFLREIRGHLIRQDEVPISTRYMVGVIGGEAHFDTSKARRELGWEPRVSIQEGLELTGKWLLAGEAAGDA